MKKNLGRAVLAMLIFLHVEIFASTYTWSATSNKTTAYVNEPIYLKYICEFSDRAEFFSIEFNPAGEHEKYLLKNLRESENIVGGKKISSYEFVLFAKEAGKIELDFEAVMKQTTRDAIEEMVIGRDNVKKVDFIKKEIKQEVLTLDIKETNSTIVGELGIEIKKNEPHVKAYEPYHMQIVIKGSANFEAIKPIAFKIDDVKTFAGEVERKQELGEEGEHGEWSQKFAFVASKDFTIPKIEIEYFNLKTQKTERLAQEAITVKVEGGFSKEELLDEADNGSFKFNYSYLQYILVFIAGFFAAKIEIKKRIVKLNPEEEFRKKIDEAKSLNELMILLALRDSKKYEHIILDIESKKIVSLSGAKKLLLKVTK